VNQLVPFPTERTAVLTGAASARGIGRALASTLAAQGWHVAVLDVDGEAAEAAAGDLGCATDVSDEGSVDAALRRVEAELPPVVGLGNLAGISSPTPFLDETREGWERVFAVNVTGTFLVTQRVVRGMVERGVGRVVSVSSISAQRGGGTYSKTAYSASKGAVIGFTRALAREVGEHGVTVNCVSPGPVDTDIMGGPLDDGRKAAMSADTLVGRVGTVTEVAALMAFLLGEHAGYITAATYDINGGLQVS
jgi:2-hydroxycyclohexanecarboxyl-CoA dehydrogenase